jgi:hypothetical protein
MPIPQPNDQLRVLRSERERASPTTRAKVVRVDAGAPSPSSTETEATTAEASDPTSEVRKIRVRSPRFATSTDLLRYLVRHAERRRPRELHETRLLLRARVVDVEGRGRFLEPTRGARTIVRKTRSAIKKCLADDIASDPRILLGAPASLVLEQARALGLPTDIAFDVRLRPHGVDVDERFDRATAWCIEAAIGPWLAGLGSSRIDLRMSAFVQPGYAPESKFGSLNHRLSIQAAMLGWLHFERGHYEEALEYFRDARFVFHMAEFDYLVGLALARLGHASAAAEAFTAFLERRPAAPEAASVRSWLDDHRT